MTDKNYYDAIDRLEKAGVDREYIQGWIGGYFGNPLREEQRVTDAYTAGYADGKTKCTDAAENWKE